MFDRVPKNPGRVLVTPENGDPAFYATLARADNPTQEGTPINKGTLLADATAALFGLDGSAVPDDVFNHLGRYNEHWWSVLHGEAGFEYRELRTPISSVVTLNSYSNKVTITYSKKIAIDQTTGVVSLVDPQEIIVYGGSSSSSNVSSSCAALVALAPVYIKGLYENASSIYYLPSGSTSGNGSNTVWYHGSNGYIVDLRASVSVVACKVSSRPYNIPAGETTYVQSTDRSAYPDSGKVDGLSYTYLGIPFENAVTVPKSETGSYVGTGTYGEDNPNTLQFSFAPKLLFISCKGEFTYAVNMDILVVDGGYGGSTNGDSGNSDYSQMVVNRSDNSVSWYHVKNASSQCNATGTTYYYLAIA